MSRRFQILSSLGLRIIAMVIMVIDHIAALMIDFNLPINSDVYLLMRILGRIALPLFIFLAFEAVRYTCDINKYVRRMALMVMIMAVVIAMMEFVLHISFPPKNIFIDLISGVMLVYFFLHPKKKNWYYLLPTVYVIITTILVYGNILYIPAFMLADYSWFSLLLFVGFYLAHLIAKLFITRSTGIKDLNEPALAHIEQFHTLYIYLSSVLLLSVNLIWYILDITLPVMTWNMRLQSYSLLAAIFILIYNGRPGYRARWLQVFNYAFYPLHLGLIALVLYLISI